MKRKLEDGDAGDDDIPDTVLHFTKRGEREREREREGREKEHCRELRWHNFILGRERLAK